MCQYKKYMFVIKNLKEKGHAHARSNTNNQPYTRPYMKYVHFLEEQPLAVSVGTDEGSESVAKLHDLQVGITHLFI